MKNYIQKMLAAFLLLGMASFFMTGCVEHRYYHEHHEHSPEYMHRHHTDVDVNIHN